MQNKNGLEICRIALQRIALLKVYKNSGPNRSGVSDLRFRGPDSAKNWLIYLVFVFVTDLTRSDGQQGGVEKWAPYSSLLTFAALFKEFRQRTSSLSSFTCL